MEKVSNGVNLKWVFNHDYQVNVIDDSFLHNEARVKLLLRFEREEVYDECYDEGVNLFD